MYETELRRIADASRNNALTFFVGAGVSKLSGAPSWRDLIDVFCDEMRTPKKAKSQSYSSDELLKIPQVYYYSIHEDDDRYYQLIQETLMSGISCSNEIHDMMMKLHPASFVTTNYDDLISIAAIKNCQSYKVVASDQEVSTIFGDRFILKMHGDLQHRNVVLKEEDYLSYSENYKLIETMVKSIFATNTVVFVGYGINDYNIKLILNWAKVLLKGSFRKPIFIYTDKEPLPNEELTYHESRGLDVIESVKLAPETADLGYLERYKSIFSALKTNNELDPFEGNDDKEAFDCLYNLLKPLNKLNALRIDDVTGKLGPNIRIDEKGVIQRYPESNVLNKFFEINKAMEKGERSFTEEEIEKYHLILSVFKKARIYIVMEDNGWRHFIQDDIPFADGTCLLLDYQSMQSFVSNDYLSLPDKYKKAYYLSRLFRYDEAFYLFAEIAKEAYSNKNYLLFYMAESNCITLQKVIKNVNRWYQCYDEGKVDDLSLSESETKALFEQLPTEFQNEYKSLENVHSPEMLYKFSYDAFTCGQKLQHSIEANTMELGITTVDKAISQINNYTHFLLGNGIIADVFDEYKSAIRYLTSLLIYKISVQDKSPLFPSFLPELGHNGVQFDETDFYNLVECFTEKDIARLLAKHKIETISFADNRVIEQSIKNLIDYYEYLDINSKKGIAIWNIERRIKVCLTITRYLDLSHNLVDKLCSFILNHSFREILIDDKIVFLYYQIKQRNMYSNSTNKEISNRLLSYLDEHLNALRKGKRFELYSTTGLNYPSLIAYIHSELSEDFIAELKKRITVILRHNYSEMYSHIVNYYSRYITKSQKKTLIRKIKTVLTKSFDFSMVKLLVCVDARINQNIIDCLVEHLQNQIDHERTKTDDGLQVFSVESTYHDLSQVGLWCLTKRISRTPFESFVGVDAEFDFYYQYRNFDFNKFDVSWIIGWNKPALKAIAKNKYVRNSIRDIIVKKLANNEIIPKESERLQEVLQQYFINT